MAFRGTFGKKCLRPSQFKDSEDVQKWIKLVRIITKSQRNIKPANLSANKAQNFLVDLIAEAFKFNCDLLPQFIDELFYDLTSQQQSLLLSTIVEQMNIHNKSAFNTLNVLLDS